MATLPDLNEEDIFAITYYNVIDNEHFTESGWDPETVTSSGEVVSYTSYDNGVEGEVTGPINSILNGYDGEETRTFTFRAKDDGWVMVYNERMDDYFGPSRHPDTVNVSLKGNYNFFGIGAYDYGGYRFHGAYTLASDLLYTAADIEVNDSDVGAYCYKYSDATNIDVGGSKLFDKSPFSYTQGVSPIYFPVQGSIQDNTGNFYPDGTIIIGTQESFQISFDVNRSGGVGFVIDFENMPSAEYISLINDPQPNTAIYLRQNDVGGAYACLWK